MRSLFKAYDSVLCEVVSFHPSQPTQGSQTVEESTSITLPSDLEIKGIVSTEQLQELEKNISAKLHKLSNRKDECSLVKLSEVFLSLATIRARLGELTNEVCHYIDSAKRLKYSNKILLNLLSDDSEPIYSDRIAELRSLYREKIAELNNSILRLIAISDDAAILAPCRSVEDEEVLSCKTDITEIRIDLHQDICAENPNVKEICTGITSKMNSYLFKIFKKAEDTIGPPPCSYSVIALGSLSLGQMTPYSDLEFAILTLDDAYKLSKNSKVSNYFKNIANYVNFKVVLLGETVIPTSDYNIDLSGIIGHGVQFDLGGKTPIGRSDKPYELVQTIDNMMRYVRNEDRSKSYRDKILPYILEKSCFVYGNEQLVVNYHEAVRNFLSNKNESANIVQYEERAVLSLRFDTVEVNYFGKKHDPRTAKINGILKKFRVDTKEYKFGMKFDIKHEIYRLADRFIYSLSLICGIVEPSITLWDAINLMVELKIIKEEAGKNLRDALSFANYLRLKVYDYCKKQENHLDMSSEFIRKTVMDSFDLSEGGVFFKFYYVVIPLINSLEHFTYEFMSDEDVKEFFKENNFYDDDLWIKGTVHARLLNFVDAQRCLAAAIEERKKNYGECIDVADKLCYVGNIYQSLGKFSEALCSYREALSIYNKTPNCQREDFFALCLEKISLIHLYMEDYTEALRISDEALKRRKEHEIGENIAASYDSFGHIYKALSRKYDALHNFREAFKIREKLPLNYENNIDVAISLMNVGMAYHDLGYYEKALRKVTRALSTLSSEYSENHHILLTGRKNIDTICSSMRRSQEDLDIEDGPAKEIIKALESNIASLNKTYQSLYHPDIVKLLKKIGEIYEASNNIEAALQKYGKALKISMYFIENDKSASIHHLNNFSITLKSKIEDLQKNVEYHDDYAETDSASSELCAADSDTDMEVVGDTSS